MSIAAENPRAVIGNNAPTIIDLTREAMATLSAWMASVPAITTPELAAEGARRVETARRTLADLEDSRKELVQPLNRQVDEINAQYHALHNAGNPKKPGAFDRILVELRGRLTQYAAAEEAKRIAAAEAARKAAEEAEKAAREAERKEMQARLLAGIDEGVNVPAAIQEADRKFADFQRADREAARAENAVPVRMATGMGRSLSLRTNRVLVLDDAAAALQAIGVTDDIREAILKSARAYKKLHGRLPAGVSEIEERAV